MAELLRDNPTVLAMVVILASALAALWLRRGGRGGRGGRPARGRVGDPDALPRDPVARERARRRAQIQIALALFAILGFTVIGILNNL